MDHPTGLAARLKCKSSNKAVYIDTIDMESVQALMVPHRVNPASMYHKLLLLLAGEVEEEAIQGS